MIILRYLTREILTTTAGIGFCLFLLFFGYRFKKYLDQTVDGELTASAIVAILSYRIPEFMVLILPVAFFLGILVAYGRLYSDNEMVVMSSGGVSQARLLANTILSAVAMAIIVGGLSLVVTPYSVKQAEAVRLEQANRGVLELLIPGRIHFYSDDSPSTYYFESFRDGGKTIEKVFFTDIASDENGEEVPVIISAKTAREVVAKDTGIRYLELENGHQYTGYAGELQYQVSHFGRSGKILESNQQESKWQKQIESLPTPELWDLDGFSEGKSLSYRAEWQWRLSLPVFTLVLALLAVPLSQTNPRRGRFAKIIPAFIPTIIYLGSLVVLRGKIADGSFSPDIGMWSVHALFTSAALVLMWWNNGRPRGKWFARWQTRALEKPEGVCDV